MSLWPLVLFYLNRLEDAEKTVQQATGRMLEIPETLILSYEIAFLKDDKTGMERIAARDRERWGPKTGSLVKRPTPRLPAQPVDATLSNQLIHKCLP
jgi:hypothetical protein